MMKTVLERRRHARQPVTLLAKCLMTRKGKKVESAMWVKDVSEGGLRMETAADRLAAAPAAAFHAGDKLTIQDLFYDDRGAQSLSGKVRWARHDPETGNWALGIQLVNGSRAAARSGAFREFLEVVKAF
jgi:hypothetical protein